MLRKTARQAAPSGRGSKEMTLAHWVEKAHTLIEALPYMRRFKGKVFVIKYGGHAMVDEQLKRSFAMDVILLRQVGIQPVVVHGGGPQIGETLRQMGVQSRFVDGMRVTDRETLNVVEMVLAGKVNKEIVNLINQNGGRAVGLSGKDGSLLLARKLKQHRRAASADASELIDLGWVGEVEKVDTEVLELFRRSDFIPVIAPVGVGERGETYNINADLVAGRVAEALHAEKLILLTDVVGVLDREQRLISSLALDEVPALIKEGVIVGGMIPKVQTCVRACKAGVGSTHIIDGRVEHALLLEIFTDEGVGTIIH